MNSWTIFSLAFSAVLFQAWTGRKRDPHWYLSVIVPLLYGGVVAWMFRDKDLILSLKVMVYGSLLPILLLLWAWWEGRRERESSPADEDHSKP